MRSLVTGIVKKTNLKRCAENRIFTIFAFGYLQEAFAVYFKLFNPKIHEKFEFPRNTCKSLLSTEKASESVPRVPKTLLHRYSTTLTLLFTSEFELENTPNSVKFPQSRLCTVKMRISCGSWVPKFSPLSSLPGPKRR